MNKLKYNKNINLIMDFSNNLKRTDIATHAGSMAFFLFLSLVPMLIVICSIIPYTPLTEGDITSAFTDVTPDMVDALVVSIICEVYEKSAGVLSLAILATIWSAGKGVLALIRGLNSVFEIDEKRNYIWLRIVASFYTIIMLLIIILSLFVMVFGNQFVDLCLHKIPNLQYLVEVMMHFRFVFVWAILTLLFSAIYALLPNKKNSFNEQVPGAFFSSIVWIIFSYLFSLYLEINNSFGIYGSLAIIIIIMIWMYFCMYIILLGAFLNKYFNRLIIDKVINRRNNEK